MTDNLFDGNGLAVTLRALSQSQVSGNTIRKLQRGRPGRHRCRRGSRSAVDHVQQLQQRGRKSHRARQCALGQPEHRGSLQYLLEQRPGEPAARVGELHSDDSERAPRRPKSLARSHRTGRGRDRRPRRRRLLDSVPRRRAPVRRRPPVPGHLRRRTTCRPARDACGTGQTAARTSRARPVLAAGSGSPCSPDTATLPAILIADALIRPYNNAKGAGVAARFGVPAGVRTLALFVINAGNSDVLKIRHGRADRADHDAEHPARRGDHRVRLVPRGDVARRRRRWRCGRDRPCVSSQRAARSEQRRRRGNRPRA